MRGRSWPPRLGGRYYLLFAAYNISNTGTWIYRLTLPLLVLHLTGSALQTAALYALEYGPFLLLSLPGGVLADRFDRKRLLVLGDLAAGLIALSLAVLVTAGVSALPAIYAVAFLLACVEPVYHPAFQGLLPDVVRGEDLDRANSLMQSSDNVISLVGPVVAGGLVSLVGYEAAIFIDALSFAASAATILLLKVTPHRPPAGRPERPGFLRELREAARYVARGNRTLLAGSLLFTGTNFGIWIIQANLVYYLTTYVGLPASLVGVVYAAQGVGATLGALSAPMVIRRFGNGPTIVLSTITAGLVTTLLVAFRNAAGISAVLALVVALGSINVVSWFTLRQRIVPRELLGRVVATTRMLAFASIPVASIAAGALEDALHNMYAVILIGAAIRFLVGLAAARTSLGRREPQERRPAPAPQRGA